MPEKTVSADDDHTELVNSTEAKEVHESDEHDGFVFEIIKNDVHVGHSKGMINNERVVRESREGKWYPKGEPLYAAPAGDADAVVDVRRASFNVEIFAPLTLPNVDTLQTLQQLQQVDNVTDLQTVYDVSDLNSAETVATGLDVSGAAEVERAVDLEGRNTLAVYATADSATSFNLDVSPDGVYWINATNPAPDDGGWSASTSVRWEGFTGFRHARLRVAETGTAGDTADIVLQGGR